MDFEGSVYIHGYTRETSMVAKANQALIDLLYAHHFLS